MSCSIRHVALVPVCGSGSIDFIQEYIRKNIGTPILVSIFCVKVKFELCIILGSLCSASGRKSVL